MSRPRRAAGAPRPQVPLRLRLVAPAHPAPPTPPGQLEPELIGFIRALAEADAEADCRAALQRRSVERK